MNKELVETSEIERSDLEDFAAWFGTMRDSHVESAQDFANDLEQRSDVPRDMALATAQAHRELHDSYHRVKLWIEQDLGSSDDVKREPVNFLRTSKLFILSIWLQCQIEKMAIRAHLVETGHPEIAKLPVEEAELRHRNSLHWANCCKDALKCVQESIRLNGQFGRD